MSTTAIAIVWLAFGVGFVCGLLAFRFSRKGE